MNGCQSQVYFARAKAGLYSQPDLNGGAWLAFRARHCATQIYLLQQHQNSSNVPGCLTVSTYQAGDA